MIDEPGFTAEDRHANFVQSRKEAGVAMLGWAIAITWTLSVSWWLGREQPAPLLFGIPRWVVLGVFLPWVTLTLYNIWFSTTLLSKDSRPVTPSGKAGGK